MKNRAIYFLLMFSTTVYASPDWSEQKRIAVNIDDVPYLVTTPIASNEATKMNDGILAALERHNVTAFGVVNDDRLLVHEKIDA